MTLWDTSAARWRREIDFFRFAQMPFSENLRIHRWNRRMGYLPLICNRLEGACYMGVAREREWLQWKEENSLRARLLAPFRWLGKNLYAFFPGDLED